jgi:putative tryptophan/tyrosine transport system substrate-binding protein
MRTIVAGVLALAFFTMPLAAETQQQSDRVWRIGFVGIGPRTPSIDYFFGAFRDGLSEHGYVEGRNVLIEYRWPAGHDDPLLRLSEELSALRLDVLVVWGEPALPMVRRMHPAPPIVFVLHNEPQMRTLAVSFERPGGRWTGLTTTMSTLIPEQLRLLKEAIPRASRLAIVWDSSDSGSVRAFIDAFAAAQTVGLQRVSLDARKPQQLEAAFSAVVAADVDALLVLPSTAALIHRTQIVDLASRYRLPVLYPLREFAEAGGLVSYGVSLRETLRRAASYVDRILTGARPGDLPIERPRKFDLVINGGTAKALGLTIPPSLLLRADQVIE